MLHSVKFTSPAFKGIIIKHKDISQKELLGRPPFKFQDYKRTHEGHKFEFVDDEQQLQAEAYLKSENIPCEETKSPDDKRTYYQDIIYSNDMKLQGINKEKETDK